MRYLRSAPHSGQKALLLRIKAPHFGHARAQSISDPGASCFRDRTVFVIVASPTARMAPKANPRRTEVSITSVILEAEPSPGRNSAQATVDTMPAAPTPTSAVFISIWLLPLRVARSGYGPRTSGSSKDSLSALISCRGCGGARCENRKGGVRGLLQHGCPCVCAHPLGCLRDSKGHKGHSDPDIYGKTHDEDELGPE